MRLRSSLLSLLLLSLLCIACTKDATETQKLSEDYQFVVSLVHKIKTERVSQLYYTETLDQGGDLRTLVTASMKDPRKRTTVLYDEDPRPWSILIEEDEGHSYTISAYGESTAEAEKETTIDLSGIK